jgi:hypothetical protein
LLRCRKQNRPESRPSVIESPVPLFILSYYERAGPTYHHDRGWTS